MGGTSDRYQVSTIYTNLYDIIHFSQRGELFFSLCLMSEPTVMQWFDSCVYGCICISTFLVHFNIPRLVRTWTANNAHIYRDHIRMLVYGIFWNYSARPHSYKGWPTSLSFFGDCVLLLLETATVWGENKSWQTWCCRDLALFLSLLDKKTANSPGPSSTRHTQKEVGIQWHLCVRDGPRHSTSLGLWLFWANYSDLTRPHPQMVA